jgi:CheY-like chemotaxis protein
MAKARPVLIIDDDPDFLDVMHIILTAEGYDVRTATNAERGLEIMRQERPLVVIVDVMMSYVLDGWAIGRRMKTDPCLRGVPVILVSAIVSSPDDPLLPDPAAACFDVFMSKPLEPDKLVRTIDELAQMSEEKGDGQR